MLMNVLVDGILLQITARLWGVRLSLRKMTVAFLFFLLLTWSSLYNIVPVWLLILGGIVVIIRIIFPYRSLNAWVGQAATYYVICFMVGGGFYAIAPYSGWPNPAITVLSFIGGGWVVRGILGQMESLTRVKEGCRDVRLIWNHKNIEVSAFVDTGNLLTEPWTGKGVSVAEKDVFLHWFTEEQLVEFTDITNTDSPFCFIPFQAAGASDHEWMAVLKMDDMIIDGEHVIHKPLIGLHPGKLSAHHSYQMLLHPDLMNEWEGDKL
ncbi:sigma-E processing peptidase SpoIIGA [Salimicrobium halophilum]|uniref:Sigma-E processing peptidase SpoIIGA n=1 Tax=Salimicrobium halophilum TaxID=86666 RepID=A0A1G8QFU1_9BACI|nr:sigma-E processing peptidase SpoIIGA [Salimicrobium halophilum]